MHDVTANFVASDGRHIKIHGSEAFEGMRRAGRLAAECLDFITPHVQPKVPTERLDKLCHDFIVEHGATEGTLESLTPDGDAIIARYLAPQEILRFVVVKGPITIDGASLTVIDKTADTLAVSLVEYTQQHTNLTRRKPGDRINLESDIIARYVAELLQERPETT